ncbi:MAG: hypothetical protein JKY19_14435 [Alcanivoracaceae bacterium]|nr:hypothetical protein [Alcanivoracaceae bacterium]
MIRKGSRYENTRAFNNDKDFAGSRARELNTPEGIVEYTITDSDRLDHLANNYYKNDSRWWRILDANVDLLYGFELINKDTQGDVIIIPSSQESKT